MKKTKLIVDFEYDFELLGITSSAKFHKLCWSLNKGLHTHLVKIDDHVAHDKAGKEMVILNAKHEDESCEIYLYKNKSPENESQLILPEMPHFDYVLKIIGCFQTFASEEVLKQLRDVKYIEYIAGISMDKLKSRDNFLH
ncbi:MAG: IPExxxVDY family protein [Fulvivirga sp.]|uniref:IPExxxVDY family protein n=1 Tax=Fulvivirga sp. TaxID=1931237 RepID=UPI0032EF7763